MQQLGASVVTIVSEVPKEQWCNQFPPLWIFPEIRLDIQEIRYSEIYYAILW